MHQKKSLKGFRPQKPATPKASAAPKLIKVEDFLKHLPEDQLGKFAEGARFILGK